MSLLFLGMGKFCANILLNHRKHVIKLRFVFVEGHSSSLLSPSQSAFGLSHNSLWGSVA